MSTTSLFSLVLFSTMLAFAYGNPNALISPGKVLMVVEGMVYCQSCAHAGTWSLSGAKPLPLAKVGISCKDHKNRVGFYKSVQVDNSGYFYAPLEGLALKRYYKGEPIHACTVRLLSSSNGDCNLLTNINGGIEGSMLRDGKKTVMGKGYKAVVYAAGPLAFRSAYCPPGIHY